MPATISASKKRYRLADLLAYAPPRGILKQSDLGGGADTPFESTFSNLAHQFIQDKAPQLMDYEVGFQLVSKNAENTKAVGVFGFQIGKQWVYAPVFFLNGKLKGYELLYVKNQDQFIPLSEEWINYLLGRKPSILGESMNRNLSLAGVLPPNLYQIARNPYKFACEVCKHCRKSFPVDAQPKDRDGKCPNCGKPYVAYETKEAQALPPMASWFQEFLPDLARLVLTSPEEKTAGMKTLPNFLRDAGPASFPSFLTKLAAYPEIFEAFSKLYDKDFLPGLAREFKAQRSLLHDKLAAERPKPRAGKTDTKADKVQVITLDEVTKGDRPDLLHGLDSGQRQVLLKERVVVHDRRDDKEVTVAYNVQTSFRLQNPDQTGVYSVLVKPDRFERCLVLYGPYSHKGKELYCTVVSLEKKGRWLNVHPSRIWTQSVLDDETFEDWFRAQPKAEELPGKESGLHLLVLPGGQGTTPFRVTESYSAGPDDSPVYDVAFERYCALNQPWFQSDTPRSWRHEQGAPWHGSRIRLTHRPGRVVRVTDGEMDVPDGARLLTLQPPAKDEEDAGDLAERRRPPGQSGRSVQPPFEPGNPVDAAMALSAQTTPLRIYSDGKDLTFNENEKLNKTGAFKKLIFDYGLREKAAHRVLAEAERLRHHGKRLHLALVKQAYGNPVGDLTNSAPSAPSFPEPNVGYDPMTGANVPTMMPSLWHVPLQDPMSSATNRDIYYPGAPDPRSLSIAQQAAQTGQKEVFDTTMLASLLKVVRQESMVDRYLPDIMKGMDRLGRILFILYWHGEEFSERYGAEELPELEDALRNAFESVGTILLELKKKTIDPNPDDGTNVDLGPLANQS